MRLLDCSVVGVDEIDGLGHMNVRYYMARADRANERLLADFGLDVEARRGAGATLSKLDIYCRYHREQFAGHRLEVHGGVLDATAEAVRLFYEVRNPQRGEIAASFIIQYGLRDLKTRVPRRLPDEVVGRAQAEIVGLPDYGAPRSLQLHPPRLDITLREIEQRLGDGGELAGMMGGRLDRVVEAEDCDAHGFLREGEDLIVSSRMVAQRRAAGEAVGPPTFITEDGGRFGWAWMETRTVLLARPRLGDVMRSVGADIGLRHKTRHSRRWTFNLTRGELAGFEDILGLALDLDARRAIAIPSRLRAQLEQSYAPEFA